MGARTNNVRCNYQVQQTIPSPASSRKAKARRKGKPLRLDRLEALAAYVNLKRWPADWEQFCRRYPGFLTRPEGKLIIAPGFRQRLKPGRTVFVGDEQIAVIDVLGEAISTAIEVRAPLDECQRILRAFWERPDERLDEALTLLGLSPPMEEGADGRVRLRLPASLPSGTPSVDEKTGKLVWEFRSHLQAAVWDLIQEPWRAKVCRVCNRYYVADAQGQIYCSINCRSASKAQRSLDFYYRVGQKRRRERNARPFGLRESGDGPA